MHLQLHNHLNAEISMGSIHNLADCVEYLSWTFFFRRLIMNPSYYKLKEFTNEAVSEYLSDLIRRALADLHEAECVRFDDESGSLECTALGKIASSYYIDFRTASFFKEQINDLSSEESTVQNICFILAHAAEFSELPVRHCEDELNAELATKLPWALSSDENFESSNIKTFLLLQAHFCRAPLPITDYINDTKSVLDQIPRVLNSFLDIAALEHRYDIVRALIKISQMIVQGLSEDSNSLCQLPGLSPGAHSTKELCNRIRSSTSSTSKKLNLPGLLSISESKANSWVNDLVDSQYRGELMQYLRRLPVLSVEYSIHIVSNNSGSDATEEPLLYSLSLDHFSQQSKNYQAHVVIKCNKGDASCRVYAPRTNKLKSLAWWVIISCKDRLGTRDRALIGIKRIEIKGSTAAVIIPFQVPEGFEDPEYVLEAFSDAVFDIEVAVVMRTTL